MRRHAIAVLITLTVQSNLASFDDRLTERSFCEVMGMNSRNYVLASFLVSHLMVSPAFAYEAPTDILQYPAAARFITTSGLGTVKAIPDETVVSVNAANWNKELRSAYTENDALSKKIVALAIKYKMEKGDVQAGQISISATYPPRSSGGYNIPITRASGYNVSREITFVLKDVNDLPSLLSDAIDAGATSISRIHYDLSDVREYRDKARNLAVQAAREKAADLAAQLNTKLGKALIVKESTSALTGLTEPVLGNSVNGQSGALSSLAADQSPGVTSLPTGELKVSSAVVITFELTD